MGDKGGRSDMDRIGLFKEMTYVTIGDKYSPAKLTFNEAASKGKQMLPGGNREKCAKQDGYFSEKFSRILEGESYSDPVTLRRKRRMEEAKKNLSRSFYPTNGNKTMNGLGTFYGTLGGNVSAFSPTARERGSQKQILKNLFTNPGKKGTGYGYLSVTLGKYPASLSDPFDNYKQMHRKEVSASKALNKAGAFRLNMHPVDYFDINPYKNERGMPSRKSSISVSKKEGLPAFKPSHPGKVLGGMKAGTFDPYPKHSDDPYVSKPKKSISGKVIGKVFMPSQGPKSFPYNSIVDQNVKRSVNATNFRSVTIA